LSVEKLREDDNITPLDARNIFLQDPGRMNPSYNDDKLTFVPTTASDIFVSEPANPYAGIAPLPSYSPQSHRVMRSVDSTEELVQNAAPVGELGGLAPRPPTAPGLGGYGPGYRGVPF
jgi:hypothetical protein